MHSYMDEKGFKIFFVKKQLYKKHVEQVYSNNIQLIFLIVKHS
jgi:hypothetical protein